MRRASERLVPRFASKPSFAFVVAVEGARGVGSQFREHFKHAAEDLVAAQRSGEQRQCPAMDSVESFGFLARQHLPPNASEQNQETTCCYSQREQERHQRELAVARGNRLACRKELGFRGVHALGQRTDVLHQPIALAGGNKGLSSGKTLLVVKGDPMRQSIKAPRNEPLEFRQVL